MFTGVGLAHGQYYAHPGMVDVCARALAVDPAIWRRLEEDRLWSQVEAGTVAAGGIIADRLKSVVTARAPEPLPELFLLDDDRWRPGRPLSI